MRSWLPALTYCSVTKEGQSQSAEKSVALRLTRNIVFVQEDALLMKRVKQFGQKHWALIAEDLPGR